MQNQTGNIISTGAGFTAFIAAFGHPILKAVGLVDAAMALYQFSTIYEGMNWQPIWALVFSICAAYLAFNNFNLVVEAYKKHKKSKVRHWNTDVGMVIPYIQEHSMLSTGLQGLNADELAKQAFITAAKNKKIRVSGRVAESSEFREINPSEWALECITLVAFSIRSNRKGLEYRSTLMCNQGNNKKVLYEGLMVDRKEVEQVWPNTNPSAYSWMEA